MELFRFDNLKSKFRNTNFSQNRNRVNAMLLDFFSGDKNQVRRMMKGYDNGIKEALISEDIDTALINKIYYNLVNNDDMKEEKIIEVLDFWGSIFEQNLNIELKINKITKKKNVDINKEKNVNTDKKESINIGWVKTDSGYCYFNDSGEIVKNSFIDGIYYVNDRGVRLENEWLNSTYYFGNDGTIQKSCWIANKYYVNEKGKKETNCWVNGYYVDAEGKKLKNCWFDGYYLKNNGKILKNSWLNDKYFGNDGKICKNCWIDDTYYVNENGEKIKNKWINDINYLNGSGARVKSGSFLIDGHIYYFNEFGNKVTNKKVGDYYYDENGKQLGIVSSLIRSITNDKIQNGSEKNFENNKIDYSKIIKLGFNKKRNAILFYIFTIATIIFNLMLAFSGMNVVVICSWIVFILLDVFTWISVKKYDD